ncbi:glycosyltransferase [Gramella sp. AN32]|uniref:Glycosyltransferase n=1 Tax=Christiangramia antarctica TaxID=2058158 RepID=A0ABW5X8K9_9FLAO|nr:glycosyltransferase [Gramella sp. AN32]
MKISIITATYNSEKIIISSLTSINFQTYKNVESVIIDGASKDNTVSKIKKIFTGDLKIISEKDNGIYDALNKGINLACGDVIGFVHSDDFLASREVLSKIARVFQE